MRMLTFFFNYYAFIMPKKQKKKSSNINLKERKVERT